MIWAIVILIAIVGAWYWYEADWDRHLFKAVPGSVCANLHGDQANAWLRAHPETQVLDVRSTGEFESGALPNAVNISISDEAFKTKVAALDKEKPVPVYCAGGYRSRKAVIILKQLGFRNIQNIHRGYMSWKPDTRMMIHHFSSFLLLGCLGLTACKPAAPQSVTLTAEVPRSAEVMGTGTLEARMKTTVSTRIQERLAEVLVDQGDRVKKGQLLARLDDAELQQQVAIAEASLNAAKQTALRVEADLARAEAVLAQARLDEKRLAGLLASSAVSQTDADKAAEALKVAEADLKRSNASIAEAQGQVLVAEKTLLYRREQLAFTQITAPYDGLIIRRDREPGDMLVPGASLMEIISLDELWVSAWVDEMEMPRLAPGQAARVVFRSEPEKNYPGVVSRLGRETDRETREFLVDVRVDRLPANWAVGQRAEVHIQAVTATP